MRKVSEVAVRFEKLGPTRVGLVLRILATKTLDELRDLVLGNGDAIDMRGNLGRLLHAETTRQHGKRA